MATSGEVQASGPAGAESGKAVIDRSKAGSPAPDFIFADGNGQERTLADFVGRPLLVNLWATWCAPCVAEMPQLETLAKEQTGQLTVLALSQDTKQAAQITQFFADKGYAAMKLGLDPDNDFSFHYATGMLPTTVLYDAEGKEVARVIGAMDWTGEKARKLIAEAG